jgi:hypothetical protein
VAEGEETAEGSRVCEPNSPPRTLLTGAEQGVSPAAELPIRASPRIEPLICARFCQSHKSTGKVQFQRSIRDALTQNDTQLEFAPDVTDSRDFLRKPDGIWLQAVGRFLLRPITPISSWNAKVPTHAHASYFGSSWSRSSVPWCAFPGTPKPGWARTPTDQWRNVTVQVLKQRFNIFFKDFLYVKFLVRIVYQSPCSVLLDKHHVCNTSIPSISYYKILYIAKLIT